MDASLAWLEWARKLDMLAQAGLTYSQNPFDLERYHQVREIACEIINAHSNIAFKDVKALLDDQSGYTTPKIDIRGVVFRDEKILMVKELSDGGWTLPGGWVDVNEPPGRAAEREVWEESGYRVKAGRLLAVYDRNQHGFTPYIFHIWKVFILCELIDGKPTPSIETGGAAWFAEGDYPRLSIARTTPVVLDRMFTLFRHPELPADFD